MVSGDIRNFIRLDNSSLKTDEEEDGFCPASVTGPSCEEDFPVLLSGWSLSVVLCV